MGTTQLQREDIFTMRAIGVDFNALVLLGRRCFLCLVCCKVVHFRGAMPKRIMSLNVCTITCPNMTNQLLARSQPDVAKFTESLH